MSVCFGVIVRPRINQRCVCVSSGVLVRSAPCDPGACVRSPSCRSVSCAGFSDGAVPRRLCGQKPLNLLGKHGVTLKAQKCHLFTNEVEYLVHVVRPGRLSVNEKNLKAIKKASFPQTQTQLRSLLGMCNVYRRFTVDFAKTAKPLNNWNSVKLPKRFSPPTPEEQNAFDNLREQLCHPPILAIPRKEGKYIIDVDASYDQLGCCLLQQQPDGKYLPVGFFSKGLLPAEKNYTPHQD